MEYSIITYDNRINSIPDEVYISVSRILHDAFEERIHQGIDFTCGHFTPEDLKSDLLGDSYLFVAIDDKGMPVGGGIFENSSKERLCVWRIRKSCSFKCM